MPAVLTHKAITLLARDRLKRLHEITERAIDRKTLRGTPVTDVERKLARLTRQAADVMSQPPLADPRTTTQKQEFIGSAPDLYQSVSKFAVLGSMGPDLPGFSHLFQPGQVWVFDTIHKGTPDYNREAVVARTTDMALSFFRIAKDKVQTAYAGDDAGLQQEMRKVRAYVMGHLCHVAGDIISHPFINDLEWHRKIPGEDPIEHSDNEKIIDADVAAKVFRRGDLKPGQNWADWWPNENEVEDYFYESYVEAFQEMYGTGRGPSFKDYEDDLAALNAPDLTPEFMKDGYGTFRGFVMNFAYEWGYWDWFGSLTPVMAPVAFAPLIGLGLPNARDVFGPQDPNFELSERGVFEWLTLPLGAGGLSALIYSALLMPYARKDSSNLGVYAVFTQAYTFASWLTGFIEAWVVDATGDEGIPDGARWAGFFVLPLIFNLTLVITLLVDLLSGYTHERPFQHPPKKRRILLSLPLILPLGALLLVALIMLFYIALRQEEDTSPSSVAFILGTILWGLIIIGGWFVVAALFNNMGLPEKAKGTESPLRKHAIGLFDDQTLFDDPSSAEDPRPLFYSSDVRPLARLWWEGDGDMRIRSDRFGLTFKHSSSGAEQTVPGPMVPMTVTEYLALLEETVTDGDGTAGGLKGAVFSDEEIANYTLPTGAVFAGHGDFEEDASEKDITNGLAEFRDLGDADEDDAYMLYHAPKPYQAIHFTPTGSFVAGTEKQQRKIGGERGYRYVVDINSEAADTSDALMAQAADLGALLCLGAVGRMQDPVPGPDRLYQVFRNWSLDRRRINEWRMLVAGKARSDKAGGPGSYDPAMPQGADGPADPGAWQSPLAASPHADALEMGESTARGFGWIPTLREFSRLLQEDLDLTSTDTDPVRPDVPAPQAVARAMAFLVDAADPMDP